MRMFFPTAALFLAALTPAHAYTITLSAHTDSASYTGATLGQAVAFDPDMFVSPLGSLDRVFIGGGAGATSTNYVLSDGNFTQRFDSALIKRGESSLAVLMSGDLFYKSSLVGTAAALFDLSEPALGSQVSLLFVDAANFDATSPMSTPETSTWMMMGLGFAALGFAGWRKRAVERLNI